MPRKVKSKQTYGERKKQEDAMDVVPMHEEPSVRKPPITPGGPGSFVRPTERPMEPITSGVASGPGMGVRPARAVVKKQEEEISARLIAFQPLLEELAALPGAGVETKRFVNKLRVKNNQVF
tara:strand:+ start:4713 stop:5078 length:366 start_codon:yes stop_codon:yes gene_type:complete